MLRYNFAGATDAYYVSYPDEFSATASILLTRSRSTLSLTKEFTIVTENAIVSRSNLDALITLPNVELNLSKKNYQIENTVNQVRELSTRLEREKALI